MEDKNKIKKKKYKKNGLAEDKTGDDHIGKDTEEHEHEGKCEY